MKRKREKDSNRRKKRRRHKNNLEWFVNEELIVPVEERASGYSHVLSSPNRLLKEYTMLIGSYMKDVQDFLVGRQMDGTLVLVHYPTFKIFDKPTTASYNFVTACINENKLDSKSKLGGFQYLRIVNPIWKGIPLRKYSTLSDIHDEVTALKEREIDLDIQEEEYTEDEMELEKIIKEMEEGEPIQLDNETIEMLLDSTDPEKYNKGYSSIGQ